MLFFKNYYIGLIIELSANNIILLLSLSSLFFAAKVIKSLFLYGSKKEGERLKEEIFKE